MFLSPKHPFSTLTSLTPSWKVLYLLFAKSVFLTRLSYLLDSTENPVYMQYLWIRPAKKMEHYPKHSELFPKHSKSNQAKQKVEDFVIPPSAHVYPQKAGKGPTLTPPLPCTISVK